MYSVLGKFIIISLIIILIDKRVRKANDVGSCFEVNTVLRKNAQQRGWRVAFAFLGWTPERNYNSATRLINGMIIKEYVC